MPRIPSDLLERIKHETPLRLLVERSGVALKVSGENLLGLCPMHEDHDPSLVLTPSRGLWHCLGACQAGGTVIDWVMKAEGLDFREAVDRLLAEFFPLEAASLVRRAAVTELSCPLDLEADDQTLLNQYADFCHELFKTTAEPRDYAAKRCISSDELVSHFKLGYANRTLGLRLPNVKSKAGLTLRTRLQDLGILRASGHEHLVGSLVIPIRDSAGNATGMYGRKTRNDLRTGTPDHLYLPGPHRGVFNVEAFEEKTIILTESLIDALSFWGSGLKNVTSAYGVEGFTEEILGAFSFHEIERCYIAFDRDEAGDRGARRVAEKLMAAGVECFRVLFPKGMDANDVVRKMKPAEKTLGLFLRSAEWIGKGRGPERPKGIERPEDATKEEMQAAVERPDARIEESCAAAPAQLLSLAAPVPLPETPAQPPRAEKAAKEEMPAASPAAATDLDEFILVEGDRRYRVRGLRKNLSYGSLRLNVFVSREGDLFDSTSPLAGFFVDTFDLYAARARSAFERQASLELGVEERVIKHDLGAVLRRAEELQQEAIAKALEPKARPALMSAEDTEEAMRLLRDPQLLDRILHDFSRCGVVGEETNKLVGYLAATSRKLDRPLAVILQSSSAAGKSSLMEAILDFMPEEEREKYSALTGMSLFYFTEEKSLRHKILAVVEEEGAERASYALKLLQSEGELTIASTGKDPHTGRLVTQEYRVEGPVMIFLTTTAAVVDEELLNRCLVLSVDENREQTRRIHELQRRAETIEGLLAAKDKNRIVRLHRNAQRLLRPLLVANPYAGRLTFLDDRTRTRRDHVKYLTLIRAIALLHQHQREVKTITHEGKAVEYIEATLEDIATANRLAAEVLGRSLDELPPQTRRLLMLLEEWVGKETGRLKKERGEFFFSRKQVRTALGWADTQMRVHLGRLVELEYVLVHRGGRGQSFVYELLYEGQGKSGQPFLIGLADDDLLRIGKATETSRGQETDLAGGSRGLRGPVAAGVRDAETPIPSAPGAAFLPLVAARFDEALLGGDGKMSSYPAEAAKEKSYRPRRYFLRGA
jgi:DNA primase catalytic core